MLLNLEAWVKLETSWGLGWNREGRGKIPLVVRGRHRGVRVKLHVWGVTVGCDCVGCNCV